MGQKNIPNSKVVFTVSRRGNQLVEIREKRTGRRIHAMEGTVLPDMSNYENISEAALEFFRMCEGD